MKKDLRTGLGEKKEKNYVRGLVTEKASQHLMFCPLGRGPRKQEEKKKVAYSIAKNLSSESSKIFLPVRRVTPWQRLPQ